MDIAIIGAGFGGMAAAFDLVRAGHTVTIFESADHVGGLASGFKQPHWEWSVEKFYHHWFQSDHHLLTLVRELGLEDRVFFPRPYTVVYHKGGWYPFDSILNALLFPGLGWGLDKIRFGLVGLGLRLSNNWKQLEASTAHQWIQKWAGKRVYETMWQPLLVGKFGPYYQDVNMAWFWARLKARTTRLGTYKGGFQQFADDFAQILRQHGVVFQLQSPVRQAAAAPNGKILLEVGGETRLFDRCLSTTSPHLLAQTVPDLPEAYLSGLKSLKSMGAVVMVLSLKHQLSKAGYYWYNIPKSAGFPFLALVEHTNFVDKAHFGGEHIVYCGDYLPIDHPYFDISQEELLKVFIPAIQKINPEFSPEWINQTWLFKTRYAQPVPLVNHSQHIPAIQTPLAGLYFASMSQVYPWDRGTNFAVEIGRRAAALMLANN